MPDTETAAEATEEQTTVEEEQQQTESEPPPQERQGAAPGQQQQAPPKPGFEQRKSREREELDRLKAENERFRQAAEAARLAKLTDEQRREEETASLRRRNDELEQEILRAQIGQELQLPKAISELLRGSDRDSMLAHGESLKALMPQRRVGSDTQPGRDSREAPKRYSRRELQNNVELARSPEVRLAAREGRIDP